MTELMEALPLLLLKARENSLAYVRPILQDHGLSEPQWRVLHVLYHNPPLKAQRLAELSNILSPSLSRILSRLDNDGLVLRNVSNADQRSVTLKLSAKGKRLCQRLLPKLAQRYQAMKDHSGSDQIEQLTRLLQAFIAEPID